MRKINVNTLINSMYDKNKNITVLETNDGYVGNGSFLVKKEFVNNFKVNKVNTFQFANNFTVEKLANKCTYSIIKVEEKFKAVKLYGEFKFNDCFDKPHTLTGFVIMRSEVYKYMIQNNLEIFIHPDTHTMIGKKGNEVIALASGLRINEETWNDLETIEEAEIRLAEEKAKKEEQQKLIYEYNEKLANELVELMTKYDKEIFDIIISSDKKIAKNKYGTYSLFVYETIKYNEWIAVMPINRIGHCRLNDEKQIGKILIEKLNELKTA